LQDSGIEVSEPEDEILAAEDDDEVISGDSTREAAERAHGSP